MAQLLDPVASLYIKLTRRLFRLTTSSSTVTGLSRQRCFLVLWAALHLMTPSGALAQADNPLVGIWVVEESSQVTELLFRSDGRYQSDMESTDPDLDFSFNERGRYEVSGQVLKTTSYEYFGKVESKTYEIQLSGDLLTLTRVDSALSPQAYQLKPGSKADVLAREKVEPDLIRIWGRAITFVGRYEYTFRPGGYYVLKKIHEGGQFPPDYFYGRYEVNGFQLTLKPYSAVEEHYEMDFFGPTLTLIRADEFSGDSATYGEVPDSGAEVRAKAAEADAFLNRQNWQVGVWEVRDAMHTIDLTFRPDGHYSSTNDTEFLRGLVRGRYTLETRRLHLSPFVGQDIYSRDNGDYGKSERTREIDYYDGELRLIDLGALSQSVTLARKRVGSEATVLEMARLAQTERAKAGWHIGIWEVNDPTGWMEFTLRPDNRYLAKSGTGGIPSQVERGRYLVAGGKITLEPYAGLGNARGFDWDYYDGNWFLVGDVDRMVIARKVPGSETTVTAKTRDPEAMKGEGGSILGLWTASLPGESSELVFRQDGQFRLNRCVNNVLSQDYGLYAVDMATRTLISDSRFVPVQTLGLDFYGDTLTIHGGTLGPPRTYTVNLGVVDQAIAASHAADAQEAQVDAQWITRVPVGPRDPNAVQVPTGAIPADPNPGSVFADATVLTSFQFYRRLHPGFVYFNDLGSIRSVAVVNTSEWYFFPTGRVLVRFTNYRAGLFYPTTVAEVSDNWGAYLVAPKSAERDILHLYADNSVFLETDLGEQTELTLEDGRRHLFWNKDYEILSLWAAEQKPIPCPMPGNADARLINVRVSLSTTIPPDEIPDSQSMQVKLSRGAAGNFTLSGAALGAGPLVLEGTANLAPPVVWQPLQTNSVAAGPFNIAIPQGTNAAAYFRVRAQ